VLRISAESILTTLFPADCRLCGTPLVSVSRLPVCQDCLGQIKPFSISRCNICGETLPLRGPHLLSSPPALCTACDKDRPIFVAAFAFGPYDGIWRDIIHLLKYERIRSAADTIARRLAPQIPPELLAARPLLVPVPLHKSKFRLRGFNQAEEIARTLCRLCPMEMNSHLLVRTRPTTSQTGMTPLQRRENVRGAFQVRSRYRRGLAGRTIILIDDVFTTGATASECARVLRRAGAAQVFVITAARVTRMVTAMSEIVPDATGTHAGGFQHGAY
jgi:ComF family protein